MGYTHEMYCKDQMDTFSHFFLLPMIVRYFFDLQQLQRSAFHSVLREWPFHYKKTGFYADSEYIAKEGKVPEQPRVTDSIFTPVYTMKRMF